MTLSQEQRQQLSQMTIDKKSNWEVSRWLTDICGLSFREASTIRHEVVTELKNTYEETRKQEEASRQSKEVRSEEGEVECIQGEIEDIEESKESCISCGSEDFSCTCEVKRTSDVPF